MYGLPISGDTGLNESQEVEFIWLHQNRGFEEANRWLQRIDLRRRYWLSPNGSELTADQENKLAWMHSAFGFYKTKQWLKAIMATARGKEAERLFVRAWNDRDYSHLGVQSVRAATRDEDLYEKTDAVLTLVNGIKLRIQIKIHSSRHDYREFLRERIFLVCIRPDDSPEKVRKNTIKSILRYKEVI